MDTTSWIECGDTQNFTLKAPPGSSGELCEVEGDPDRYLHELIFADEAIPALTVDRYEGFPPGIPGSDDAERLAALAGALIEQAGEDADEPVEQLESGPAEGQTTGHIVAIGIGDVRCLARLQVDFFGRIFVAQWQGPKAHAELVRAVIGTFNITL